MSNTRTAKPRTPKKPPPQTAEFRGQRYRIADAVGIWPLMQFARAADSGMDTADMRAMSAIHAFLQDCLDPADWGRFQDDVIKAKVNDVDELLTFAQKVVTLLGERSKDAPVKGAANGTVIQATAEPATEEVTS